MKQHRIYFTGFMGSGKSTLTPMIANMLGYNHLDLDAEIEQQTGITISEIFKTQGEPYFRQIEQTILRKTFQSDHLLVALGGGTITFQDNLQLVKSNGLLVYLKATPEVIMRRVKRKQNRPLLYDEQGTPLTEEALRIRIDELLAVRNVFYSQADLIIPVGERSVAHTVDRVTQLILQRVGEE